METIKSQAGGEEPSSPNAKAEPPKTPLRQRLVICLDGTWNKQESGTNIYHLSNLIVDGEVTPDGWLQRVRYDSGVGTGVLDGVTGGAFGIGLSENVVESYDWLVEHYNDGDEISVFGFSRGAFTARSLVALISKCGLLYRGAPISPSELWAAYQILGRHLHTSSGSQPAENWWERVWGKPLKPFRELREFHPADWDGPATAQPENRAERLLKIWSRRVPVKCVGVFDTVGSMGLDALAIPWLRTVTAQFHDTRLNSIIQNGFQALAIDEHRANFQHIPWNRVVGETSSANIKQRWFGGVHSNVGGGYEDDALAMFPLQWMIEECSSPAVGLVLKKVDPGDPNPTSDLAPKECVPLLDGEPAKPDLLLERKPSPIRDSYAEIAKGLWQHIIRAKRNYRRIAPPPETQNGMAMQSVNEELHESVLQLRAANTGTSYHPPNLFEYRKRLAAATGQPFTEKPPVHRHLDGKAAWIGIGAWLAGLALAGWWLAQFFANHVDVGRVLGSTWDGLTRQFCGGRIPWTPLHCWFVAGLPLVAFLVDWRESVLNFQDALDPDGLPSERRKGWLDFYLALRLGALGLWAAGVLYTLFCWLRIDWPLSVAVCWLLVIDALLLWFMGGKAWAAGPMTDAGLGSIVALQRAPSPTAVKALLEKWAKGQDPAMLAPVSRTIWRDILGFIPAYSVTFFFGIWVLCSLWLAKYSHPFLMHGLLAWHRCAVFTALGVAAVCAIADWVEDAIHLSHLRTFPNAPGGTAVLAGRIATSVKFFCFILGLLSTFAAALWLVKRVLWDLFQLHSGGIALLVAVATCLIAYGVTLDFVSRTKGTGPESAR